MVEYEDCAARLEDLMARINRTNSETRTEKGTLTEQIAPGSALGRESPHSPRLGYLRIITAP